MIYFKDIFDRAFNLFDDPDISQKYYGDQAGFQKDMLDYLKIGINKFTSPTPITDKLVNRDNSVGYWFKDIAFDEYPSTYDEEEDSTTFTLEPDNQEALPVLKKKDKYGDVLGLTFWLNGKKIPESFCDYTYDEENKKHYVTFYRKLSEGDTWGFAWFYAGAFTSDFSDCLRSDFPMNAIMEKVINILAYATLSAWGDKEVGRVLEVRNILTDTDFKMYSPANSARAKVEWRDQMNKDMDTLISELTWRIMSTPSGGSRFGR